MASFAPSTVSTSQDFLPLKGTDHVEFYVGNAKPGRAITTAARSASSLVAYAGPETGQSRTAPPTFSARRPLRPHDQPAPGCPIAEHVAPPQRRRPRHRAEVRTHAPPALPRRRRGARRCGTRGDRPTRFGTLVTASIATYGDTIHTFVERAAYTGTFCRASRPGAPPPARRMPTGLRDVDHCVGNVGWNEMERWAGFYARVFGFSQLASFDDKDISTEYTALIRRSWRTRSGWSSSRSTSPRRAWALADRGVSRVLPRRRRAAHRHRHRRHHRLGPRAPRQRRRLLETPDSYYDRSRRASGR